MTRRSLFIGLLAAHIVACIGSTSVQAQAAPLSPRVAVKTGAVGALSDAGIAASSPEISDLAS